MTPTYIDANILVYAFGHAKHPLRIPARRAIEAAANEGPVISASLAVDEFLWALHRQMGREGAIAAGRDLLQAPILQFVSVDPSHLALALDIMSEQALHPRDAIHLAVARDKGCGTMLTDDPDFRSTPELEIARLQTADPA